MATVDTQYEDLLRHVMAHGSPKSDRTGTGTRSVFGAQLRFIRWRRFPAGHDQAGAPEVRRAELLWFLRGDSNVRVAARARGDDLGRVGGQQR